MAERTDCPDPNRWQQFLHGDVAEHEKTELDQHLEVCECCQKTLDGLVADQASWSDMARQLSDAQPEIERAYERDHKGPGDQRTRDTSLGAPEDSSLSLFFLQPPEKPDSLGRLAHYEILEVIGRGGMGIVLRAFDDKLHRVVAIKVMSPQLAATSPPRKRFLREARAAAIRHEHVVDIHAVVEEPIPYLVMEYVPGENLQQKLDRVGPLEVPEVLRIGEEIARGLAAAHSQGVIHRDIKPANILLASGIDQRVKITDFGLARVADDASLTQSGMIAGTPMYMAPEQTQGETTDHRADLFSLGSVMYAMCAGRPPFRASSSLAVLKRVAEDTPRPIREIIPEVPQWLCDIIARLQAKKPADRFQTAQEVADLLSRCLAELRQQGQVILVGQAANVAEKALSHLPQAKSEVRQLSPRKRLARGRRAWGLAAAVALLLLGGLSFTEATGVTNLRANVIRIFTGDGTLVVEVNDPGVKVVVEGDGDLVITGAGPHEVRLRPGSYKLQAAKHGKPVRLDQELVTITRGGKQVVRVAVEPKGVAQLPRRTFVTPWSDSDDWVVEGQELFQPNDSGANLVFGDPNWTDYDFEAEFKIIAGGSEVGLDFRATSRVDGLYAVVGAFGNTCHGVFAHSEKGAAAIGLVKGQSKKGRWYRLRIEARGERVQMFLDGNLLTTVDAGQRLRGCVGFLTNGCSARFRNLKVTDPSGKVLFEGVRNILPKAKKPRAILEVEAQLQNAIRLNAGAAGARFALGVFYAQRGEWKEAADAHDRGLELDPSDHERWCQAAALHLVAGDLEGYRRTCRELVQRFGSSRDPVIVERTAKSCFLLPNALSAADFERMQKQVERTVSGTEKHSLNPFLVLVKALADYRADRNVDAVSGARLWVKRFFPIHEDGWHLDAANFAILAIAHHRLDRAEEAAAALAIAKTIMTKMPDPPGSDWHCWLIGQILSREAEALLKKK